MITEEQDKTIAHVHVVLGEIGFACRDIHLLSPQTFGKKANRVTLRVVLETGSTIKVRCLESAEAASRLTAVRSLVGAPFTPVIEQHGGLLVEPWIDGRQLTPETAAARAGDAGAILGHLHATPLPVPRRAIDTRACRRRASDELTTLSELGVIAEEVGDALNDQLSRTDPVQAPATIVHMDYCPENIVADADGGLHVIDNEWIRVDAAGLDLGRTFARWPMGDETWARFLAGYLTTAPVDPGPLRFWMIVMASAAATIRLHKSPAELSLPVARLRDLSAT